MPNTGLPFQAAPGATLQVSVNSASALTTFATSATPLSDKVRVFNAGAAPVFFELGTAAAIVPSAGGSAGSMPIKAGNTETFDSGNIVQAAIVTSGSGVSSNVFITPGT